MSLPTTPALIAKRSPWFKSLAGAVAATTFCLTPAAWGASASDLFVTLDVKPSDTVSVSRSGLNTYVAYRATLKNRGGNTINQVVFTGTTTVAGASDIAAYDGILNLGSVTPKCSAASATSVVCQIGQLKSNESRDFFLFFKTSQSGTSVHFDGVTNFSEGGSSGAPPANFTALVTGDTGLTETLDVKDHVNTVLKPDGGDFFTGVNGKVDSTNPFATKVTVPAVANLVTDNAITESIAGSTTPCAQNIDASYFCYGLQSTISINSATDGTKVNFGAPLVTIFLRQDISSLTAKKPTPSLYSIRIFYTPTYPTTPPTEGTQIELLACSAGNPATLDHPCIANRTDNTKGSKGYYEYEIHAQDNGKFGI
jgi:hypothetical protein